MLLTHVDSHVSEIVMVLELIQGVRGPDPSCDSHRGPDSSRDRDARARTRLTQRENNTSGGPLPTAGVDVQ
jgi:hypothetical protein